MIKDIYVEAFGIFAIFMFMTDTSL